MTDADPKWLALAKQRIGLREGPGEADNPLIVAYYALCGQAGVKHDSVPWCAAFVGAMLALAGLKGTNSLRALSYSEWGYGLHGPAVGAIATKKRAGGGHVFFVAGWNEDTIFALGGNQGDAVCIQAIPRDRVEAYRWPRSGSAELPNFDNRGVQHAQARALSEA